MNHTIAVGIQCSLHQMFFQRCACTILIFMEKQESLRQLTVIKPLLLKQVCNYCLVVPFCHQDLYAFAFILLAHLIKRRIECKFLHIVKEMLLKICRRHVILRIEEGEHVLKHTACGSTGRNKLHNFLSFSFIAFPCLRIHLHIVFAHS